MTDQEYLDRMVVILRKIPEKRLLIIDLANQLTKDGSIDYQAAADIQPEINLAIAEAKAYGTHTLRAVDCLWRLRAKGEVPDVGPG